MMASFCSLNWKGISGLLLGVLRCWRPVSVEVGEEGAAPQRVLVLQDPSWEVVQGKDAPRAGHHCGDVKRRRRRALAAKRRERRIGRPSGRAEGRSCWPLWW